MRSKRGPIVVAAAAALVLLAGTPRDAVAHDLERTQVAITFAADGSFALDISNDPAWLLLRLEPFAGNLGVVTDDPRRRDARLTELGPVFIDRLVLFVDGHEVRPASVEYRPPPPAVSSGPPPLATYRLRGRMAGDARTLRFYYGLVIDPYPFTIRRADGSALTEWIGGNVWSRAIDLTGQFRPPSRWHTARQYLGLGYTHILPKGIDHILFVLGIVLLSTRLRPILLQVTSFTLAHSITLGLTMYGVVSLPSRVVEPLIALSIAYVAIENLVTTELKPWRIALVFSFGLLHGMGFAGVLKELGLPRSQFLTALLTFNLGVEGGQLTVIALASLAVVWWRHDAAYHRRIVVPVSLAIACVGLYWTIARAVGSARAIPHQNSIFAPIRATRGGMMFSGRR